MLDLSLKPILKIAVSVPDSLMQAAETALARFASRQRHSDQAVIRFALRSVGAMRLWPRFQRALHICNCIVRQRSSGSVFTLTRAGPR